jgi:hypothetical protein
MTTVQRSWRRSLAGLVLAAALAPGAGASRAGQAPATRDSTPPGKAAEQSPEEKKFLRQLEDLDMELSRRTKELEGAITKERLGELRVRVDELQAEKAQVQAQLKQAEAKRRSMQAQQLQEPIKVFRLKQENPQEVGQVLHLLLAPEGGYYFLGRGSPPGPRANPPGERRGRRRGPPAPSDGGTTPPEGPGEPQPPQPPQLPEVPGGMGRSPRPHAAPELGWTYTVDPRTNALIVRGSPHVLEVASDLVAVLNTPPSSPLPRVKTLRGFRLKYASPREVADILRQLRIPSARAVGLEKPNLLIVMASDADLKEIGDLVKDLDVETKRPPAEGR